MLSKKFRFDTLFTIRDIIDVLTNSKLPFLSILSLRLDWDFTFSALHKFSYGNKNVNMDLVDYTNIQSKIKINGLLSNNPFTLIAGIHRGCPLSMLLYISAAKGYLQF